MGCRKFRGTRQEATASQQDTRTTGMSRKRVFKTEQNAHVHNKGNVFFLFKKKKRKYKNKPHTASICVTSYYLWDSPLPPSFFIQDVFQCNWKKKKKKKKVRSYTSPSTRIGVLTSSVQNTVLQFPLRYE